MSVKDIIFSASMMALVPTEAPTMAPTAPTLFNEMPVNSKTVNEDMSWWDMCYDNTNTFGAIRRYKPVLSISNSPIPGATWSNIVSYEAVTSNNAICGNNGTFIVAVTPVVGVGKGIIHRFKYNETTGFYDATKPLTIGSTNATTTTNPLAPTALTVTDKLNGNPQALCCAYGAGVFFVGGNKWYAYSKDDGITWKVQATTYIISSVVFGEAKSNVGKVPRFLFTTTDAAPNEKVGFAVFDANNDLTIYTTLVSATAGAKCAYSDGIFLIMLSTSYGSETTYTEDMISFETGPSLPISTLSASSYKIVNSYATLGNIKGGENCFIAVPSSTIMLLSNAKTITNSNKDYIHTISASISTTGSPTFSATIPTEATVGSWYQIPIGSTTAQNPYLNSYMYKLSTERTASGWSKSWEYIPLTHSKQELVNNWPVVSPETATSVYAWSEVGPYRAVAYGKGVFLAARHMGDKCLTVNPNFVGSNTL